MLLNEYLYNYSYVHLLSCKNNSKKIPIAFCFVLLGGFKIQSNYNSNSDNQYDTRKDYKLISYNKTIKLNKNILNSKNFFTKLNKTIYN